MKDSSHRDSLLPDRCPLVGLLSCSSPKVAQQPNERATVWQQTSLEPYNTLSCLAQRPAALSIRDSTPSWGVDSYALLTRSLLTLVCAFNLHVLGLSPAFTLSQDQTLASLRIPLGGGSTLPRVRRRCRTRSPLTVRGGNHGGGGWVGGGVAWGDALNQHVRVAELFLTEGGSATAQFRYLQKRAAGWDDTLLSSLTISICSTGSSGGGGCRQRRLLSF